MRVLSKGAIKVAKGKPLYLGRGAKLSVAKDGSCSIGSGVYLSRNCIIEVMPGAKLIIGENVFMNDGCRVVVAESVEIDTDTIFGPDVKIYDHDHVFNKAGVHDELVSLPVSIGKRCWLGANSVVTRGVRVSDCCLISAGAVVTHSCVENAALYGGVPAKQLKKFE